MSGRVLSRAGALAFALFAFSLGTDDALATTFCVPGFSSSCPNSGGDVAESDLEKAMSLQGEDGLADEIRIAPGAYTESAAPFEPSGGSGETLEPGGSDPLTIVGAGAGSTVVTSSATANVYIVNLAHNNSRVITMRDLTVRVPATVPDGLGGAFQLDGDTLEDVDIVSLNPEADGVASVVGPGNVFRGGEVRGESGGSISDAIRAGGASGGSLLVEDAVVKGASWALEATEAGSTLTARRTDLVGVRTYGVIVTRGTVNVENTRMTIDDGIGLYASAVADGAAINANHITVLDSGASYPAIEMQKASGLADASVTVADSILRGFSSGYKVNAAAGPGIGHATLTARYSNFPSSGTNSGILDLGAGNIDADPLLDADLSLPASSPSVDAGDPSANGLTEDFAGAPRPRDGNGDGVAVGDQGAFEYQPATLIVDLGGHKEDVVPPQTRIAKGPGSKLSQGKATFRFRSSEAHSTFVCKLDKRKPKRCGSPKAYRGLRPGKHVFKVWAIDAAGNRDPTPAKRRFRVPAS